MKVKFDVTFWLDMEAMPSMQEIQTMFAGIEPGYDRVQVNSIEKVESTEEPEQQGGQQQGEEQLGDSPGESQGENSSKHPDSGIS